MKKHSIIASLLLAGSLLTACGAQSAEGTPGTASAEAQATAPASVQVTHTSGETDVKINPDKVAVFEYGILDMMDQLGIKVTGMPQTQLPASLAKFKADGYTNTGTLQEPDFEKLAEMAPNLIIIGSRTHAAYAELSKLAPTIEFTIDPKDYLGSMKKNAEMIGKIYGKETEAQAAMKEIEARAASIREKVSAAGETALILMANDGALSAYGASSRFGLIHSLGFTPIDTNIEDSTHGQNVTFEYVLEKNPDHIFVIDRSKVAGGSNSAEKMFENPLAAKTKAYAAGNIHYLDPFNWYIVSGGINSTKSMLSEVEKAIQ